MRKIFIFLFLFFLPLKVSASVKSNIIENILERAEKLISTENLVRKSIREGMDPQEAYLKYSVF